jgi:hypothetical protein
LIRHVLVTIASVLVLSLPDVTVAQTQVPQPVASRMRPTNGGSMS